MLYVITGLFNNNSKIVQIYIDIIETVGLGIITKIQFDKAYENAINIFQDLKCNPDKWKNLIKKYFIKK